MLSIYSEGYSFGFDNPQMSVRQAKNLCNYVGVNCTIYLRGFKDGKKAAGR
jgi:hypothetical protein